MSAYRTAEDRLGAADREDEAIREYGAWRSRTQSIAIAAALVVGLAPATVAYYLVTSWQLDANGVASLKVSMLGAAAVWGVMLVIGVAGGKLLVRARTPKRLDALAARWEVERARVAEVVEMAQKL